MKNRPAKEMHSLDDATLLEAVAQKDAQAFSVLYEKHSPQLFGLAIHILNDRALAEDVLQEVFLAIWENARSFDTTKGGAKTWLLTLCRNRCIDKLRVVNKKNQRSSTLSEELIGKLPANPAEQPDALAGQVETKDQITQALQLLPREQQELIELAYFGGRTQSELATELDLPLGTVKTRIRLGMQKLKTLLQRER